MEECPGRSRLGTHVGLRVPARYAGLALGLRRMYLLPSALHRASLRSGRTRKAVTTTMKRPERIRQVEGLCEGQRGCLFVDVALHAW